MRLLSLNPIGWIYRDGTAKCSNIIFECVIFNNHHFFDARYVYQAESFILFKKCFNISRWLSLCHFNRLSKKVFALLSLIIANSEMQLSCSWTISKCRNWFKGWLRVSSIKNVGNIVGVVFKVWAYYFHSPSKVFQSHYYTLIVKSWQNWTYQIAWPEPFSRWSGYCKRFGISKSIQVFKCAVLY